MRQAVERRAPRHRRKGGDRTDLCRQKGQSVRGAPTLACRSAAGVGIAATGWQGAASLL